MKLEKRATARSVLLTGRAGDHESKQKAQSVSPEKVGGLSRGGSLAPKRRIAFMIASANY